MWTIWALVLSQPEVTVAISGSDTGEQLDEKGGALGWEPEGSPRQDLDKNSSQLDGKVLTRRWPDARSQATDGTSCGLPVKCILHLCNH